MLCEKCGTREARVKITRVINGVSETHNYCPECAGNFHLPDQNTAPGWSNMLFRLLSDAAGKRSGNEQDEQEEMKLRSIACPTCKKTYGEFLEDGKFGCEDCYEAFSPHYSRMILSIQGASGHTGKKSLSEKREKAYTSKDITQDVLTPEEEAEMLRIKMQEAVSVEDYEKAAVLRDRLKALENGEKT